MVNEVQRFDIAGLAGSGQQKKTTFTMSFAGSGPSVDIECALPDIPDAVTVQSALEGLSTIGVGNIGVSKDAELGYVCTFQDALGDQDLPELVADTTNMSGATVTVSTVTDGVPPIDPDAPPISGKGCPIPATLHQFVNWLNAAGVLASGIHNDVVVTSDGSTILLTPALAR